jgi:hypothetical protein
MSIAWFVALMTFSFSFFFTGLTWGVSVTRSE